MKRSKLDSPPIREKVIQCLGAGESHESIAKDMGLNQSQVSRFANKEEIKDLIEQEQKRLLEVVGDAVENIKGLVREIPTIPKKDIKRRELSYKASLDTLKAVGIMPTPVQSQVITNIYEQKNLTLSPVVQALIHEHLKTLDSLGLEEEKIDGEKKE
ncbi:MAG: hypothetical protein A2157_02675 [Deltaproteobacteria bacterium RBG_16_47_11]|nr:MAG: hypothetical protein A2157_02675 [Deltaproteobacteria bacterium RBG_16_47_11]